ncbi:hypothetical protein N7495_009978 [Penicillium taxi]|uniref:uncharacterized protein n=1 Tax=Penicillium taxi TaxID=168475 RepID=UPI0025458A7F|nr:uncharacterized protein N7495_009978 [Penicillium taxi]KAJ5885468.1 hypothetical protein N7495_009978 [Penicillium taxi]
MAFLTQKTDARKFWSSGGNYLQRSTLHTPARCISGCEISDDEIKYQTFEGSSDPARDTEAAMILTADINDSHSGPKDLTDAVIASMKAYDLNK